MVAAFEPRAVALADKACGQRAAQRRAVGREPMIGEGQRAGEISGPEPADAADASLRRVVSAGAVALDGGQSQPLTANTAGVLAVTDGKPCASFQV
jgi:hypothetical protein